MRAIIKLSISQLRDHWVRTLISACALVASISLIVIMVGGFAVTLDRATDVAKKLFGRYDLAISAQRDQFGFRQIRPQGPRGGSFFDRSFIESLKSDPMVKSIFPVSESRITAKNPADEDAFMGYMAQLVGTDEQEPPNELVSGRWLDRSKDLDLQTVVDKGVTDSLNLRLGDIITLESSLGRYRLRIIGITGQSVQGMGMGNIYVTNELFQYIVGRPPRINRISVQLKEGVEIEEFEKKWQAEIAKVSPNAQIITPESIEQGVAEVMNMGRVGQFGTMKYVSGILSVLAAVFIIFTTLNIGVREAARQFAMLRAVGMTRVGISLIILFEGIIFALIGLFGGLLFGWILLHWTMRMPGESMVKDVPLDLRTILTATFCSFGASLLATIVPIISAVRRKPLEAMMPMYIHRRDSFPKFSMIIGLTLIAIALIITASRIIASPKLSLPFFQFDLITFPLLLIGFVLFAPLIVILVEKLFTPVVSFIFGLDRRLLSQQLTSNIWRTVGTTIALMVGLGLYITMQTWGRSMMVPFSLPDRSPDMIVTFIPNGIPSSEIERVRGIPGVKPNEVIPMIVEQPKLSDDIVSMPELKDYWMGAADNVMIFGCDLERTILGDQSMLSSRFVRGNREEALNKVNEGGYCIITDQLYIRSPKRFDVGNKVSVLLPVGKVDYTIAGIVNVPGWHWITKMSRMRIRSGRTAAIMFIPYERAIEDIQTDSPNVFWLKLESNADKGLIKHEAQKIAQLSADISFMGYSPPISGSFAAVVDVSDMKRMFLDRSKSVIWLLSKYPLYALLVASLGVSNAVFASVWARRWEMGVLRSIGLTRSQMFRLIVIEAILIGITACILSFAFGIIESWAGIIITGYNLGVRGEFIIPWKMLTIGFAATLILCVAASVWPAWSIMHDEPLQILQAGRASM